MSQHFLLSAAARSLSAGKVMRMSDRGAENVFARLRWPTTDGKPVCPDCGCPTCYDCRRGAYPRWRCKACGCDFSVTSGTLFAWHKLPLKTYLLSIVVFCNEVKGKSMLALSRDLGVQYKTAFVLAHKLREAMASALRGLTIGGEGKVAEIDGAYFGGHVRPENLAADRIDRRLAENQSGKRQVVVVMRERDGRTFPQVSPSEAAAVSLIRPRIAKGTVFTPMRARPGISCTPNSRCNGSTIKRDTASTAPAPIAQNSFFTRIAAGNSGIIIISRKSISSAMPRKQLGEKILAASATAIRSMVLSDWQWALRPSVDLCGYWQRAGRLDHPPSHAPRRLDAFDRIGRPVQRTEHGIVNQFARACIVFRQFLRRHDALNDF